MQGGDLRGAEFVVPGLNVAELSGEEVAAPEGHPGQEDALKGIVKPLGGHADAALHNGGDTRSVFTSWSKEESIARDVASEGNGPGVVLRMPNLNGPGFTRVASPDVYGESDVLIKGTVTNSEVLPWKPYLG